MNFNSCTLFHRLLPLFDPPFFSIHNFLLSQTIFIVFPPSLATRRHVFLFVYDSFFFILCPPPHVCVLSLFFFPQWLFFVIFLFHWSTTLLPIAPAFTFHPSWLPMHVFRFWCSKGFEFGGVCSVCVRVCFSSSLFFSPRCPRIDYWLARSGCH